VVGYGDTLSVPTIQMVLTETSYIGNLVGSYIDLVELIALVAQGKVTSHNRTTRWRPPTRSSTTSSRVACRDGASSSPTAHRPNPRAVDRDLHGRRVFEKTGPAGRRGVRPIGFGLIALGILVLADLGRPPWIPGLWRGARLNRRVGGAAPPAPSC